jgi:hypothetical protein
VYNDGSTYFRAIDFVNASTGFSAGPAGKVFKTTDYGNTWNSLELGISDADVIQIDMVDENTGFLACSDAGFEHGYIFKTTDGGSSWNQVHADAAIGYLALAAVDDHTVYAGGNSQTIIKTTDGGQNWSTVHTGDVPEAVYRSADSRTATAITMVDDFGNITSTEDAGTSWTTELTGSGGLFCVHFPLASKGYSGDLDGNIYSVVIDCVIPGSPGNITGDTAVCAGTEMIYWINSVPDADFYNWTAPTDAAIVSGQGDTSVIVLFGAASGEVTVTAVSASCGSGGTASVQVTVNTAPQPSAITGAENVCEGQQAEYSISSISGVSDYQWTVPEGSTILTGQGDTSITILIGAVSGEVSVTPAGNECGDGGTASITVTVNPLPLTAAISGDAAFCEGETGNFSTEEVTGADSYEWMVPSDAIILSGQGTTSIGVQFGAVAGAVTVTAVSANCGNGTTVSFPVILNSVPAAPAEIAGGTVWCSGDTTVFSVSSVPGADSYNWSVPNSCEIISGQGDTVIVAVMATGSGLVKVSSQNTCGISDETSLPIDVNPTPSPSITQVNDTLYSSSPEGNQWYYNGSMIPGATDEFYVAMQNGTYYVVVTSGFGCSAASESLEVVGVGITPWLSGSLLEIYPNPSAGNTYVQLSNLMQGKMVMVDQQGRKITERQTDGNNIMLDVSGLPDGIYFIKLLSANGLFVEMKKLVVQ